MLYHTAVCYANFFRFDQVFGYEIDDDYRISPVPSPLIAGEGTEKGVGGRNLVFGLGTSCYIHASIRKGHTGVVAEFQNTI